MISRRNIIKLGGAAAVGAALSRPAFGLALGPGPAVPPAVDALIARMTIAEKAGQLTLMPSAIGGGAATKLNPGIPSSITGQLAAARAGQLTGIFNGAGVDWHRRLQREALRSRLGIPLVFAADIIHGHRTVFPVPLGEAASFEPDLARRTARVAATEAAAAGIDWTFAPMVDIARDARWGRGVEGAGEDVYLGRQFAAARVAGFQGDALTDNDAVAACAKHFAAYGAAEAGLDYNGADVSERTLRETYFPPFESAFEAGAATAMAAFNDVAGVPATANRWLLSDVLRGEWNFTGLVVSDYTGDEELIAHGVAADGRDAARLAILAGVDMSMASGLYLQHLPGLVADGLVPMGRVDEAVRRVLALKARLGLLEDPYRRLSPSREKSKVRTPANLALARDAARRSVVLLKNEGDLLPLKTESQRIALIGPFASGQHDLIGPWCVYGDDNQSIDLATGIRAALKDPKLLTVTEGSKVDTATREGIQEAVHAARRADVVVLALGETASMSGEAQSRTSVTIPAAQIALAEAVAAAGKPVVVVLKNGRALALDGAVLGAPAILVSWFLGSATGPALADVLFGLHGPSARLPVSFPRESGQEPYYYDHKPTGRPNPPGPLEAFKAHWQTGPHEALFPFGHGLTYGRIGYSGLDVGGGKLAADGRLAVSVKVANTGTRDAEEVVQLYIRDQVASTTRPVRQLKGFRKVALAAGASATVGFTLSRADLLYVGLDEKPIVEPGLFDIWIGPSAVGGLKGSFELLA
ncbi:glycoside hydrolase family 3 C-terminal domain-containing protein [Sphingosinicellaceae bacterium]|nr:glycoside hydrolase family 3 C-terminal domain-containing protein [Sphingosinicellaceae bacterium]